MVGTTSNLQRGTRNSEHQTQGVKMIKTESIWRDLFQSAAVCKDIYSKYSMCAGKGKVVLDVVMWKDFYRVNLTRNVAVKTSLFNKFIFIATQTWELDFE